MKKITLISSVALSLIMLSNPALSWTLIKDKGDVKFLECGRGKHVDVKRANDGKWIKGGDWMPIHYDTWQKAADAACTGYGG